MRSPRHPLLLRSRHLRRLRRRRATTLTARRVPRLPVLRARAPGYPVGLERGLALMAKSGPVCPVDRGPRLDPTAATSPAFRAVRAPLSRCRNAWIR